MIINKINKIRYVRQDTNSWYLHSGKDKELYSFFKSNNCISTTISHLHLDSSTLKKDNLIRRSLRYAYAKCAVEEYIAFYDNYSDEQKDELIRKHYWLKEFDFTQDINLNDFSDSSIDKDIDDYYTICNLTKNLNHIKKFFNNIKKDDLVILKSDERQDAYLVGTVLNNTPEVKINQKTGKNYLTIPIKWETKSVCANNLEKSVQQGLKHNRSPLTNLIKNQQQYEAFFNATNDVVIYAPNKFSEKITTFIKCISGTDTNNKMMSATSQVFKKVDIAFAQICNPKQNITQDNLEKFFPNDMIIGEPSYYKNSPTKMFLRTLGISCLIGILNLTSNINAQETNNNIKNSGNELQKNKLSDTNNSQNLLSFNFQDKCTITGEDFLDGIEKYCNELRSLRNINDAN